MRVRLSGVSADVEIDETLTRRALCKLTKKIRLPVFTFFYTNRKLEAQILLRESLLLNRGVIVTVTFLDPEIDTRRRVPDDNAKSYLPFHGNTA